MEVKKSIDCLIGYSYDARANKLLPFRVFEPTYNQNKEKNLPDQLEIVNSHHEQSLTTNLDSKFKKISNLELGIRSSVDMPIEDKIDVLFGSSSHFFSEDVKKNHVYHHRGSQSLFDISLDLRSGIPPNLTNYIKNMMTKAKLNVQLFLTMGTHIITGVEFGTVKDYVFQVESTSQADDPNLQYEIDAKINFLDGVLQGTVDPNAEFTFGKSSTSISDVTQWLSYVELRGGRWKLFRPSDIKTGKIQLNKVNLEDEQQRKEVYDDPTIISLQVENLPYFLKRNSLITDDQFSEMKKELDRYCRQEPLVIFDGFHTSKHDQTYVRRRIDIYEDRIELLEHHWSTGKYTLDVVIKGIQYAQILEHSFFRTNDVISFMTIDGEDYIRAETNVKTKELFETLTLFFPKHQ